MVKASLPAGVDARPFEPGADDESLVALIHTSHRLDDVDDLPSLESFRSEQAHFDGFDPRRDVLVVEAEGGLRAGARITAAIRSGRGSYRFEGWVAPAWRGRGIGRALLAWIEERAAEIAAVDGRPGPGILETWIDATQAGAVALFEEHGYAIGRYGLLMTRDLGAPLEPPALPDGLEIRPVEPAHHRQIWDADTEAFRDHWNSAERTEADFEGWFAEPEINTSLWRVAWDGAEVAGAVMPSIWPAENRTLGIRRGWLDHVSVRRPWRRRGLASALIVHAMAGLRAAGMTQAALGTDAENLTGAVRVYERLGFERTRTTVNYRKSL
ncbi:MAG TPA: GNAT family N-acetyltransferase [Candidatus Limnocylindrales bacterium]|nr:GNAT family N-acetyltransferase [Candidatus Limnocylindrales bacterium]